MAQRAGGGHRDARAAALAEGLTERGWAVVTPQTNIVLVTVADLAGTLERFEQAGVRATPMAGRVRLMTHADVSEADIAAAVERIGPVEGSRTGITVPAPRSRSGCRPPR